MERVAGGEAVAGLAVVDGEQAEVGVADFPGQTQAVVGVDDVTRIEELEG